MTRSITITHNDRRRLATMLESAHVLRAERQEYRAALEAELELARGIEPTEVPENVVTMNSTVELRDLDTGERETYTIVYPENADIERNRISVLAPIATAVLGCQVGDVVEVAVPFGLVRIRVEGIPFQPERIGAFNL